MCSCTRRSTRPTAPSSARSAGGEGDAVAALYLALLHHPVYDKNGAIVTTAVTNLDVHDLARIRLASDLDGVIADIEREVGVLPRLVATTAREGGLRVSFATLRQRLAAETRPELLVLGTGWGLTRELLGRADDVLEPIRGSDGWNHLSVRAAAAIILD